MSTQPVRPVDPWTIARVASGATALLGPLADTLADRLPMTVSASSPDPRATSEPRGLRPATPALDADSRPGAGSADLTRRLRSVGVRASARPDFVVTVDAPARVLRPVGDLDLAAGAAFTAAAATVVGRGDVTVDLAGVRFVDAGGLGVLITFANRLAREGHRLWLLRPTVRVRRVFGVAGLAAMLPPSA